MYHPENPIKQAIISNIFRISDMKMAMSNFMVPKPLSLDCIKMFFGILNPAPRQCLNKVNPLITATRLAMFCKNDSRVRFSICQFLFFFSAEYNCISVFGKKSSQVHHCSLKFVFEKFKILFYCFMLSILPFGFLSY